MSLSYHGLPPALGAARVTSSINHSISARLSQTVSVFSPTHGQLGWSMQRYWIQTNSLSLNRCAQHWLKIVRSLPSGQLLLAIPHGWGLRSSFSSWTVVSQATCSWLSLPIPKGLCEAWTNSLWPSLCLKDAWRQVSHWVLFLFSPFLSPTMVYGLSTF